MDIATYDLPGSFEVPTVHAIRLRDNQFRTSSKLSPYNESFPALGTSRLLWALSADIVLTVPLLC